MDDGGRAMDRPDHSTDPDLPGLRIDREVTVFTFPLARATRLGRRALHQWDRLGLESLEARGLLSHVAGAFVPPLHPGHLPLPSGELDQISQRKHPLNEKIVGGHVRKLPMFYGPFLGVRSPNLDAIGANGRLIRGQGFVFTGEVLGPISKTQPAVYTFGINRGGAQAPGSFPNRPMIYYDSLVTITTGPTGPTGSVQSFRKSGTAESTVTLPAGDVQVAGDKVQVEVPASLLPSTSPPGTHLPITRYFYAFWAGTSATSPSGIASFAPEYAITRVAPEGFAR